VGGAKEGGEELSGKEDRTGRNQLIFFVVFLLFCKREKKREMVNETIFSIF